jgi:hypothetical protein
LAPQTFENITLPLYDWENDWRVYFVFSDENRYTIDKYADY